MHETGYRRCAAAACLALAAGAAQSQTSPWSVRVGPAALQLHVDASPESPPGSPIPGAGLDADDGTTLGVALGYGLTPQWTGWLTLGVPLRTTLTGTGPLAPLGRLGSLRYGPATLTGTYAFGSFGAFRPYAGAGLAYLVVVSTADAALANLKVDNAFGSALQIGTDIDLGGRVGLFVDVKKIYLKTDVDATVPAFGGAPAHARVRIDPLVIHAGLSYRF